MCVLVSLYMIKLCALLVLPVTMLITTITTLYDLTIQLFPGICVCHILHMSTHVLILEHAIYSHVYYVHWF